MRSFEVDVRQVRKRSHLPHWETQRGIQSLTFNLFDAVPTASLAAIRDEMAAIERQRLSRFGTLTPADAETLRKLFRRRLECVLDEGHGSCFMRLPLVAELVASALCHFDGSRYELYAWSVMPNHVHAVASVAEGQSLDAVLHSWKSYTSKESNRLLQRNGPFWQADYFDRAVRSADHLLRCVAYVVSNPAKAGLPEWPYARSYPERIAAAL